MPRPIQLGIPIPCQENWTNMQPAEKDRHCAACQKTVVDFTVMSDTEIIRYLAHAGPNVCGRLMPDQMNRRLASLAPPQKNGWAGWRLLLAGVLLTSHDLEHHRSMAPAIQEHPMPPKTDSSEDIIMRVMGMTVPLVADTEQVDSAVVENIETQMDSGQVLQGKVAVTAFDSVPEPERPPLDKTVLPKMDSVGDPSEDLTFVGGVVVTRDSPIDTIKQFVTDTLTVLHLLPKKEWTIYPNPVRRGTMLHLSGQTESGSCQVTLFSITGARIQELKLEGSKVTQAADWQIPAGLAAGVYIVRIIRPGQIGGYSEKLVVE
jgi:hypothetical protein